jgi:hypothetical protein
VLEHVLEMCAGHSKSRLLADDLQELGSEPLFAGCTSVLVSRYCSVFRVKSLHELGARLETAHSRVYDGQFPELAVPGELVECSHSP